MKTFTHIACLLIGIGLGFPSGQWRGEAMTLQATASPGIDPTFIADVTPRDLAKARARISVGR